MKPTLSDYLFRAASCACLLAAPISAAAAPPGDSAIAAANGDRIAPGVDAIVSRGLRAWDAPGAVVTIVRDGKVLLSKGFGVRDLQSGAAMNSATLFPIQSETKAFTALTVGILSGEGKLNLDAPAQRYLPRLRMADPAAALQVTLRDFLTHRSGLGRYSWLWLTNTHLDRQSAVERIQYLPPAEQFRANFYYSNMGYVAAARVVEVASGQSWESFLKSRVLAPLGMMRTTTSLPEAAADPNHMAGSMWLWGEYRRVPMWSTTPLTNSTGGILSTGDDMAKWMLFQLGDGTFQGKRIVDRAILDEEHSAQMVTKRPVPTPEFTSSDYGLGWYVDSYRGERVIDHQGNHWGVSSSIGLLPDRQIGVSVFVNQDGDLPAYLMFSILDLLTGKPDRDWAVEMAPKHAPEAVPAAAAASPGRDLAQYAGIYEDPGLGQVIVSLNRDKLVVQSNDDRSEIRAIGHDIFVPTVRQFANIWSMDEGQKIQFVSGFNGQVTGLRINTAGADVIFKRLPH